MRLRNVFICVGSTQVYVMSFKIQIQSLDTTKQLMLEYAIYEHLGPQDKWQSYNNLKNLTSYSSNTFEATKFDDLSMEKFPALISTSKKFQVCFEN